MSSLVAEVARDYAMRRVEELRTRPVEIFGQPVRYLNTRDAERYAGYAIAHLIEAGMIDPDKATSEARNGDPLFQHALGLLGLAERPKKLNTGPKRETNYFRDIAIVMIVQELHDGFEIKPTTSSKQSADHCGCGIVAGSMGMTYDAVCAVWKRLGKAI